MWRQLSVATDQGTAEAVADRLSDLGALSVSLEDEGDQPLLEPKPGETPIWNHTRVIGLFEADKDLAAIRSDLIEHFPDRFDAWREEEIQDQAWERAWLEHFKPMPFGRRLWIVPTGYPAPEQEDAVCVSLDPGLAFGTGTHPTTALCLEWLDGLDLRGKTVLDYGCGSGILAVAALLLGADSAIGTDIDPQALTATEDNARKNEVLERLTICHPKHLPAGPVDVLVANILANPLIELAESLAVLVKPSGELALSGILREQAEAVKLAYQPWFEMNEPDFLEDWSRLSGIRRGD
ncbi:50S ribosomal protein L11 methyltransferase [Methylococcus sp. EFPC2]|uniref:50S ribosomal protein L11 methyltransferase n=1 Tax=Methylococcus sp. EFPC2 TaxID=2812648 RepID=UPI0019682DA1|nr:50S ribosomal protein L11 methyltransferase [Methylococcus sp. EFPC2]QSA96697.1 50S ribosomal protein L11 methyltransferase [Methylococcus sp. EFPC2]